MQLTDEQRAGIERRAALRRVDAILAVKLCGYTHVHQTGDALLPGDGSWWGFPPGPCETGMKIPYYSTVPEYANKILDAMMLHRDIDVFDNFHRLRNRFSRAPKETDEEYALAIVHAAIVAVDESWPRELADSEAEQ